MKQRTANALKWGAVAATLSAYVLLPQCVEEGPRGPSRPQITMTVAIIGDDHTIPAGRGVKAEIGSDKIKLACINGPVLLSDATLLKKGEKIRMNGVELTGLDDKGVEVSFKGQREHVFLSYESRCVVSVSGKPVAEFYNAGAYVTGVWVYQPGAAYVYGGNTK